MLKKIPESDRYQNISPNFPPYDSKLYKGGLGTLKKRSKIPDSLQNSNSDIPLTPPVNEKRIFDKKKHSLKPLKASIITVAKDNQSAKNHSRHTEFKDFHETV